MFLHTSPLVYFLSVSHFFFFFFFFNDTATTEIYTFPYTTLFRSHLLGWMHVPQRRDDGAAHLERHPGGHDRGARCAWVAGVTHDQEATAHRPGGLRLHGPHALQRLRQGEPVLRRAVPSRIAGGVRAGRRQGCRVRGAVGLWLD